MHKFIAIAAAVLIVAMFGHAVPRSENMAPMTADRGSMPSPLQLMSDAKDLQATPFVAP